MADDKRNQQQPDKKPAPSDTGWTKDYRDSDDKNRPPSERDRRPDDRRSDRD